MNNDKEQITSNEKSEDVLADLSKDEHSGEETSSPESSGKKTFTDTDGSDSVNADVAAKPSILRRIILIAAICVFCYSAFMLFQIFWEYKKGNDTSVTLDDEEVEIPFVYDHKQLLSINSEGLGYLYIPSIDVRLPMVQSTDNDFYLTHTFNKTANKNGCLFDENPDYIRLLQEPSIPRKTRLGLIDKAFGAQADEYLVNFLKLLCEEELLSEFSGCEEEYRQRFQKDNNIAEAHVVSAVTLSSQQKAALKAKLEEVWKKEIILVTKTDPNLMGGLKPD